MKICFEPIKAEQNKIVCLKFYLLRNMKICLRQSKVNCLFKFDFLRNVKICLRQNKIRGLFNFYILKIQ